MSRTRIFVVQMKEIIYTAIFVGLGILLVLLLIFMFLPNRDKSTFSETAEYAAGVYTSQISLNDASLNLEMVLDSNHIKSIRLINLEESVSAMYPLVEPALAEIEGQLVNDTPIGDVVLSENSKYTQTLLLESIETLLDKAKLES